MNVPVHLSVFIWCNYFVFCSIARLVMDVPCMNVPCHIGFCAAMRMCAWTNGQSFNN